VAEAGEAENSVEYIEIGASKLHVSSDMTDGYDSFYS
jgi:hypothetical protein